MEPDPIRSSSIDAQRQQLILSMSQHHPPLSPSFDFPWSRPIGSNTHDTNKSPGGRISGTSLTVSVNDGADDCIIGEKRQDDNAPDTMVGAPPSKKRKLRSKKTSEYEHAATDAIGLGEKKSWDDRFEDLVDFRKNYGQSNVTHNRDDLRELSRWVKVQLAEYKRKLARKESNMTEEQFQKLNSIGFIWNNKCVSWEEKFLQLCDFEKRYQHCNVPRRYPPAPSLPAWVKQQRRLYEKQSINPHHKSRLESIGFEWGVYTRHHHATHTVDEDDGWYDFDDC